MADDPYTNRGRSEEIWRVLLAYGFQRSTNSKGKHTFQGKKASPCFERVVRNACKKNEVEENGELFAYSINSIARDVKSNWMLEDEDLSEKNDVELVRDALSIRGIQIGGGYYYSLCRKSLVESSYTWHCRICGRCGDWRDWHCAGCNKCQYGASIPCEKCSPEEHEIYMRDD